MLALAVGILLFIAYAPVDNGNNGNDEPFPPGMYADPVESWWEWEFTTGAPTEIPIEEGWTINHESYLVIEEESEEYRLVHEWTLTPDEPYTFDVVYSSEWYVEPTVFCGVFYDPESGEMYEGFEIDMTAEGTADINGMMFPSSYTVRTTYLDPPYGPPVILVEIPFSEREIINEHVHGGWIQPEDVKIIITEMKISMITVPEQSE